VDVNQFLLLLFEGLSKLDFVEIDKKTIEEIIKTLLEAWSFLE